MPTSLELVVDNLPTVNKFLERQKAGLAQILWERGVEVSEDHIPDILVTSDGRAVTLAMHPVTGNVNYGIDESTGVIHFHSQQVANEIDAYLGTNPGIPRFIHVLVILNFLALSVRENSLAVETTDKDEQDTLDTTILMMQLAGELGW